MAAVAREAALLTRMGSDTHQTRRVPPAQLRRLGGAVSSELRQLALAQWQLPVTHVTKF